jgi:hypothetical protein
MTDRSHEKLVSVTLQFQGFSATARRLPLVSCPSDEWNPTCHAKVPMSEVEVGVRSRPWVDPDDRVIWYVDACEGGWLCSMEWRFHR